MKKVTCQETAPNHDQEVEEGDEEVLHEEVVEEEVVEEEHHEVEAEVDFQSILATQQEQGPIRKHLLETIDVPRNDLILNY